MERDTHLKLCPTYLVGEGQKENQISNRSCYLPIPCHGEWQDINLYVTENEQYGEKKNTTMTPRI